MKKIIIIVIVAILLLGGGVYLFIKKEQKNVVPEQKTAVLKQDGYQVPVTDFLTTVNQDALFKLDYPKKWDLKVDENNMTHISKPQGVDAVDGLNAVVLVGIYRQGKNSIQDFRQEISDLQKSVPDLEIKKSMWGNMESVSYSASVVIDTGKIGENKHEVPGNLMRTFILNPEYETVYGIDYSNNAEFFETDLPTVNRMIDSFKLLN
jgi:hypothetical protein